MFMAFLIIGLVCVLIYVPATFSNSVTKMQYDTLDIKQKILTKIPFANVVYAEQLYTGSVSVNAIADIFFLGAFALRYVVKEVIPGTIISTVTIFLFIAAIVAIWAANAYIVFIIMHDSEVKNLGACIFYAIFFTLGQHYIATYMEAEIKSLEKNKETFG